MGDEILLERILNGDEEPKDLPLGLLQLITNDFSQDRKIGQGGFGEVYKGIIVSVKRMYVNLHRLRDDDKLFDREFNSLRKVNHRNVVRFLGFCSNTYQTSIQEAGSEGINLANVRERLLCFEYISNGSLDKHITDELRGLEWETRYDIIIGICKGLRYLHKEKNIVHMDLKPANILLDGTYMVPKITDFGLSRSNKNSHTTGLRFGTRGYVAPEYENAGKISSKSDVYSLGVIIFELLTGSMGVPDENN
uniref:non-specific serine/threonine protein kinase n=1 Tax=Aegilops tauschii subsp. strangulata TaxID=200361 RepID=A0A453Q983_AEGTS